MATTKINEPEEKMVRIKIPRTREDDSPTVFVSVNEKTYMIKKGEYVDVPESVALVLQNKEEMEEAAYEYEQSVAHN